MKLRQNAREIVLLNIEGLGLVLGEIRYNRQTETVLFAMEKAAFFDVHFPCTVVYDQQRGPLVHPHILAAMTTSSIRVQRQKVACYVTERDLNPVLIKQYQDLFQALLAPEYPQTETAPAEPGNTGNNKKPTNTRVIDLTEIRDRHND